ncbi:MAG: Holliday junction branch migration protein RuvA [Deltaproteobacteria bacterium]|nr:Holliday junction branch migration protein RuvA [Deltaproteobacteria bacterium]
MIARVNGILVSKSPDAAVVDVGGVGYEVFIPLSTYYKLPDKDEPVVLRTTAFIRDDSIQLYGFFTQEEKDLFTLLITVAGIGPRLSRNILSGITPDALTSAIARGDIVALVALPGVGKKTAERIVLELKDKIVSRGGKEKGPVVKLEPVLTDAISALKNLGYREKDAEAAALKAKKECAHGAGVEEIIRKALRAL